MKSSLEDAIIQMQRAAKRLKEHGWSHSSSGNISIRIWDVCSDMKPKLSLEAPMKLGELEGCCFLISRAGSRMEEIVEEPSSSTGLFRYCNGKLHLLWGSGPPTSELSTHLLIHSMKKGNVIIHCHMDSAAGTPAIHSGKRKSSKSFGSVGWFEPGSIELALATMKAMEKHDTVLWKGHGVISCAKSVDECLEKLMKLEGELKKDIHDG